MPIDSMASLDRSPKKNWVENSGGLPQYILRIANHLHQEKGMTISRAIAVAVNVVKRMCATGDLNFKGKQNVNPASHAEACAAVADWERKKAQARVSKGIHGRKLTDQEFIEMATVDEILKAGFNPGQLRDWAGKWSRLSGRKLIQVKSLDKGQQDKYFQSHESGMSHTDSVLSAKMVGTRKGIQVHKLGPNGQAVYHTKHAEGATHSDALTLARTADMAGTRKGTRVASLPFERQAIYHKAYEDGATHIDAFNYALKAKLTHPSDVQKPRVLLGPGSYIAKPASVSRTPSRKISIDRRGAIGRLRVAKKMSDHEFDEILSKADFGEQEETVDFELSGEISKSDDDKQLVFGWMSVANKANGEQVIDKQGDVLDDIDAMEAVAYDFVLNSRDGGEMHIRKGVSTLVESFMSTPEKWKAMGIPEGILPIGWWGGFHVNDAEVWKGVKDGKYKSFSVHGTGRRVAIEEVE